MSNTAPKIIRSKDEIPEGAVQVHLYSWVNVMRPRGHMKKESIGEYILEKFISYFESWTDPKYGDNPDVLDLANALYHNALEELDGAWNEFIHSPQAVKILAPAVEARRKEHLCQKVSDELSDTDSSPSE